MLVATLRDACLHTDRNLRLLVARRETVASRCHSISLYVSRGTSLEGQDAPERAARSSCISSSRAFASLAISRICGHRTHHQAHLMVRDLYAPDAPSAEYVYTTRSNSPDLCTTHVPSARICVHHTHHQLGSVYTTRTIRPECNS